MNEQPDALQIAGWIEASLTDVWHQDAADELRRLHAANVELVQELKNIAEANPLNWDAPLNDTASFRAWAQSRAQAAVAKHGVTS